MKLVLQRVVGDCGISALATLTEQSYEDVYLKASEVDRVRRGKAGLYLGSVIRIAHACGVTLVRKPVPAEADDGLLMVRWKRGSRYYPGEHKYHIVVWLDGIIVDPSDGVILRGDEYLARERGIIYAFLEWR